MIESSVIMFKNQYSKIPLSKDLYIEKLQLHLLRVEALAADLARALSAITDLTSRVSSLQEGQGKHSTLIRLQQTHQDQKSLELSNLKLSTKLKLQQIEQLLSQHQQHQHGHRHKLRGLAMNIQEKDIGSVLTMRPGTDLEPSSDRMATKQPCQSDYVTRQEFRKDKKRTLRILQRITQRLETAPPKMK